MVYPIPKGRPIYPELVCPLANVFGDIANRYESGGCFIKLLFQLGGPSNIARFIVAVVIYSMYRMGRAGSIPQVFEEVLKLFPTTANSYTSGSIVSKVAIVGVVAPTFHRGPYSIFGPLSVPHPRTFQLNCLSNSYSAKQLRKYSLASVLVNLISARALTL